MAKTSTLCALFTGICCGAALGLTSGNAKADHYPLERLRLLNQNLANLTWIKDPNIGECGKSKSCRVEHVSEAIGRSDYDVVVFQEVFDDDTATLLVKRLSPMFPHYAVQPYADTLAEKWLDWLTVDICAATAATPAKWYACLSAIMGKSELTTNSGIAIFSKWPMQPFLNYLEDFHPQYRVLSGVGDQDVCTVDSCPQQSNPFVEFSECWHDIPDGFLGALDILLQPSKLDTEFRLLCLQGCGRCSAAVSHQPDV